MQRNQPNSKWRRSRAAKLPSWFVSECPGDALTKSLSFHLGANNFWPCWRGSKWTVISQEHQNEKVSTYTALLLKYHKPKHHFLQHSANTQWWVQWFPTLIASGSQFTLTLVRAGVIYWAWLLCSSPKIPSDCSSCAGEATKGNTQKKLLKELWLCCSSGNEIALWYELGQENSCCTSHLCTQVHTAVLILTITAEGSKNKGCHNILSKTSWP